MRREKGFEEKKGNPKRRNTKSRRGRERPHESAELWDMKGVTLASPHQPPNGGRLKEKVYGNVRIR